METNWTYKGETIKELPEDVVGFVYQITNTKDGRMYIGKKLARFNAVQYRASSSLRILSSGSAFPAYLSNDTLLSSSNTTGFKQMHIEFSVQLSIGKITNLYITGRTTYTHAHIDTNTTLL